MIVLRISNIEAFIRKHAETSDWLKSWLVEAKASKWKSPIDIKKRYSSASILDGNTVIFRIKGNKYRMEVDISFNTETIIINRLGSHAEYDKWK